MSELARWIFGSSGLTPHGFCLSWEPGLIWTYAASDLLIGLGYMTIPVALGVVAARRRDLMFRPMFFLFAGFITLCGISHLLDVVTLWVPAYGLEAVEKCVTAFVSVATAIVLWWKLPAALELPSPARMRAQEQALNQAEAQAAERKRFLDMVDLAAVMLRDADGTIRFWSEGCTRLYGWTAQQAIGQRSHELLGTAFPVSYDETRASLLRAGSWTGELHHRTRDGEDVVVASNMTLQDRERGADSLVVETFTDVSALRRAQSSLQKSEAQFSALFDTAADGLVVASADGQILSVNRAMLAMFGYGHAEQVAGRNLRVLMPQTEASRHDAYIAAHRAGAAPRVIGVPGRELLAVRRDGSEFPIDLSVSSFAVNGERFLTGIIRDATARRQSEAALRESEARLRLVQRVGGIAYSDRSVSEQTMLISPEFVRLYGLADGQTHLSVDDWLALIHPGDRDRIRTWRENLQANGGSSAAEFRIRRPDGVERYVSIRSELFLASDGAPLRAIHAQQDVTDVVLARQALADRQDELERRVAERTAELAKAEARFRGIFDSQVQYISLLAPDGTTLEMNRTALDAATMARQDIIGRPFWETRWWPVAEQPRLREEILLAAQGTMINREVKVARADGQPIWVDFSLKPVYDPEGGGVMWIIAESRDQTEKRNLTNQLAQAQKVQALGQLAGGIAHDFNNILQAVGGAAALIEMDPYDPERSRRLAHTSIAAVRRGTSITQRLLSFARRGDLRAETIPTAEWLNSIREVLAHTLGTTIIVNLDIQPGVPSLIADQAQLETAIINLGTNARDAMPDGGLLILSARADHVAAGERHEAGLAPGAYVQVSVTDTGTGMDEATLARVSEPFFTTKPQGQGTGLGLAMAKGFAEQSGGAMTIASTYGKGTTVTLWLRQSAAGADSAADRGTSPQAPAGTFARILMVDDDELVREILAAQLEAEGLATLVASSGPEAIALIAAGEAVDAMVSDLSMPGMNGVTTIQRVHELRPRLPCFLLTGYVGERAALSGGNDFTLVRKPISGRHLATQIEASLRGARDGLN